MRREEDGIRLFSAENALKPELYSIRQAAKACGLSRAMLLKLEAEGFLIPREINPETGYRWYDVFSVSKLRQYQMLRTMGLSQKEIIGYFNGSVTPADLVEKMKAQFYMLQRGLEEFTLRMTKENDYRFSFLEFPDITCYCETGSFIRQGGQMNFAAGVYMEAIRRGYRLLAEEPLFSLRPDAPEHRTSDPEIPYRSQVCIPVDPSSLAGLPTDGIAVIPACKAFSILYHGDYRETERLDEITDMLWAELNRRGLSARGPMRVIGIVAPYVGMEFEEEEYVLRFAVPVEDRGAAISYSSGRR